MCGGVGGCGGGAAAKYAVQGAAAPSGRDATQVAQQTAALGANALATQSHLGQSALGTTAPTKFTTFSVPQTASAYAQMDGKTLLGPKIVDAFTQNAQTKYRADGSLAKSTFNRTVPEDRTKAAAVVQRVMQSTAKYQDPKVALAAGFDFTKHPIEAGGLLHVSRKGDGLDIDDPNMLLYRKTGDSYQLIGVVLTADKTAPDLGMGTWHTHDGHDDLMKHIWFSPGNLDVAFQEGTPTPAQV